MAIDLDVVTRLDRATTREAAREAQQAFKGAGKEIGEDLGDGIAAGISAKSPEIEKSLNKVADASGRVIVEQEKLNALKDKGNATDAQLIAQSERVVKAYRDETSALQAVNRALEDHESKVRAANAALDDNSAKNESVVGSTVSLTTAMSNAGSAAGKFASSFGQIGAVAAVGTLPAAVTAVAELGGALQQLSGAALAVPGVFAGIAASVGTAALGMNGMKDAFDAVIKASDGTEASVKAANEALAGLSPNAAEAVTTVVGLKGTFEDLRNIASQNMFAGFSSGLTGMVGNLLPSVTRGVDGISQAINGNLLQVMDSLGSSSSQGFLERILGNTAQAQGQLTSAIDPIVNAVGTLTAAGSDTLPRLAEAVGDVANRFNNFITAADGDGRLGKWIDEGLDGFTNLGNSVLNIGKAFTGITEAAGGGQSLLSMLESGTAKLAAFANSTDGQNRMATYFQQGRDLLGQLLDVAQSAGPALGSMLSAATSVAQTYLPLISEILSIINSIPGGAQAVVGAFVAWKTLDGVSSLTTALNNVGLSLGGLPGKADAAGKGISSALSKVAVPAWLAYLVYNQGKDIFDNATKNDSQQPGQPTATDPSGQRGLQNRATGGTVMGIPSYSNAPAFQDRSLPVAAPDQYASPDAQRERRGFRMPVAAPNQLPSPDAMRQRRGRTDTPITPDVSGYTAPLVTESSGGGAKDKPVFDPSQYSLNSIPIGQFPGAEGASQMMAGAPAPMAPTAGRGPGGLVVDQAQVWDRETQLISAGQRVEETRQRVLELQADNDAAAADIQSAKNDALIAERNYIKTQRELTEAQQGTYKKANDSMSGAMNDLKSVFAPMDEDFGISGGLPGIAKWLVTFLGNMALGSAIGSSPELQAAALSMTAGASGSGGTGYGPASGGVYGAGFVGPSATNGYPSAGSPGTAAPGESDRGFAHRVMMPFFEQQGLTVGDHAADKHGEHQNGALDIMVDSLQEGNAVLQQVLSDPNVYGAIFNNQTYGYGKGASPRPYGSTGGPTDRHEDHVHAWYKPGGENNINPDGAAPGSMPMAAAAPVLGLSSGSGSVGGGGTQSVFVVNMPAAGFAPVGASTPATAPTTGAPATPSPSAMGPDALQPPATPGIGTGPAPGPLPNIIPGSAGQGYLGMRQQPGVGAAAGQSYSGMAQAASGGGGTGGIGLNDSMMAMAGGAADLVAPGSSIALKLANRAIQYGGQVAAIGVSGALETFLPHGSALGDPGKSWLGKIAGGIAGARPAAPNQAGKQAPQGQQGAQGGQSQQVTNDNRVMVDKMETGGGDGQGVANDIGRMQQQQYSAGGPR